MRTVLLILCLLLPATLLAQDGPTPLIAQRIVRIIEFNQDDPDALINDLRELADSRSLRETDRGHVRRELAAFLIREQRNDEAQQVLEQALEGRPDDYVPSLRMLLGQLLLMDGDAAAALEHLDIWAAQVEEPRAMELSMLGYAYLQAEQFDAAANTFERVLQIADIINNQWYEVLAYAYTQSGRRQEAIALLDRIIAEHPAESRWWRQLGDIFILLENYQAGAASLSIADRIENLNYANGRRLAGLLSMLNMPAEGARVLTRIMEQEPEQRDFEDQMLLGELWMLARETDQAIRSFEQAASMAEDGEPLLKISQLHLQWERYPQARQALRQAIEIYGEDTPDQVWYQLAIVEINLEDLAAASDAVARLNPEGDYAERAQNLESFIDSRLAANSP